MAGKRIGRWLKVLDRYAGIPTVLVLGLRRKRPPLDRAHVRRIGLMKTAAIGDTLLLSGLVDDVRRTYPGATLVFITGADNAPAAELLLRPGDEHIVVSPRQPVAAVRSVRASRLDIVVDFGSWPRFDAMLAGLSGAHFKLGFRTAGQLRHTVFDRAVAHSERLHERDNYATLLAELGVDAKSPPRLVAPRALPDERLPPRPYAVFHPWSSGFMHEVKEWPHERWIELGQAIASRGWTIVVTGSRSEGHISETLVQRLLEAGCNAVNHAGAYTLAELSNVLARGRVVISVNTGVMHLAGLVGARTVSLEGPTPPLRWRALGPRTRAVTTPLPGCGYLNLGFEYAGQRHDCMTGITADAVLAAIDELMPIESEDSPTSVGRA